jgi:Flp pilus assembly pilin Flp
MIDRANVILSTALLGAWGLIRERQLAMREQLRREDGQAFVEYALVLVVISIVIGAAIVWTPLTDAINGAIEGVGEKLNVP